MDADPRRSAAHGRQHRQAAGTTEAAAVLGEKIAGTKPHRLHYADAIRVNSARLWKQFGADDAAITVELWPGHAPKAPARRCGHTSRREVCRCVAETRLLPPSSGLYSTKYNDRR